MILKRDSNIELLRLLSMFLIFLNHMVGHGVLLDKGVSNGTTMSFFYFVGTSIWIPAALVFVLISGYFGINPSVRGIVKYSFVCTFYLVASSFVGGHNLGLLTSVKCCCLLSSSTGLWFLSAYFYLYCLSPILNTYMDNLSVICFRKYLLLFLLMEVTVGWFMKSQTFNHVFLFMLVYSIGYYLGHSKDEWIKDMSICKCILGWLLPTSVIFSSLYFHFKGPLGNIGYNNPFILFQAVMILLLFAKLNVRYNKVINYLAKSALMVYLVSENNFTRGYFVELVQFFVKSFREQYILLLLAILFVSLFVGLLLLDKLVSKIYMPILNKLFSALKLRSNKCI